MSVRKESVVKDLVEDLVEDLKGKKAAKGSQEPAKGTTQEEVQAKDPGNWIEMPFLHNMPPDVRGKWNLQDFDPSGPNDAPNRNLSVMGLILATNR